MLYRSQSDENLVMLTLAGEQRAYEALVERHQKAVIASAMKVARSRFMAEDAAQDAFVTAWMKLDDLLEKDKYCAWVCRIAKNCALNMIRRYRSFISVDTEYSADIPDDIEAVPEHRYLASEENEELYTAVDKLSERVRTVIQLYYFEGLSIVEIADKMRISQGTVKWQLHDGRRKIREELCAMNEKWNDTLVERVMKKVEELKLWRLKDNKDGFEVVYKDVLKDVEELPESVKKYHAMADVLQNGWWWLEGTKSDELFARIKNAAVKGKNDDVMTFIVAREDSLVPHKARLEFIKTKQIPMLEEAGFTKTLAYEWFWLGSGYLEEGRNEEGKEALRKAKELLGTNEPYRYLVSNTEKLWHEKHTELSGEDDRRYNILAGVEEYRYINGALCRWVDAQVSCGYMYSASNELPMVYINAAFFEHRFFANISVGESVVNENGSKLEYVSSSETVHTPSGIFENCHLWKHSYTGSTYEARIIMSWYKDGVGIVKQSHIENGQTESMLLKSYNIVGGKGLLPFAVGNTWDYIGEYDESIIKATSSYRVEYTDASKVILSSKHLVRRLSYDEGSWADMIQAIRNEYWAEADRGEKLTDTTKYIERAEALAETPMEKAHTRLACSVARRLMRTSKALTPDTDIVGHWNFFERMPVIERNGAYKVHHQYKWSFEWKQSGLGNAGQPLLYNSIYDILQNTANCIWSDEWRVGATPTVEYTLYGSYNVKTKILCESSEPITTKAGVFNNCLKITFDIEGLTDGLSYMGGKNIYYFADGIGVVRFEHVLANGIMNAVYDLTSYKGEGEGYMPLADGLERHYDAVGLTDGYEGAADYIFVKDENGNTVILGDRTGIRNIQSPITQYGSVLNETKADQLWDEGDREGAHRMFALNSLNILLHQIARRSFNAYDAKRSIEVQKFNMNLIELAGNGNVPDGLAGLYGWIALVRSAAHFGNGENEDGYRYLDIALDSYAKWKSFESGAELSVGNEIIFKGAKVIKGKKCVIFPDGKKELIDYYDELDVSTGTPYYALTSKRGWEWFNSVKEEERYKSLCKKALELTK